MVVVGGFKHELNSFALGTTTLADIRQAGRYAEGADIFDAPRTKRTELAAIHEIAVDEGIELVPTAHFHALFAGGPIEHAIFVEAVERHRDRLTGIILPIHGTTVTTEEDDPKGDLLQTLREVVGPAIPIVATFDTHPRRKPRLDHAAARWYSWIRPPSRSDGERLVGSLALCPELRPVVGPGRAHDEAVHGCNGRRWSGVSDRDAPDRGSVSSQGTPPG